MTLVDMSAANRVPRMRSTKKLSRYESRLASLAIELYGLRDKEITKRSQPHHHRRIQPSPRLEKLCTKSLSSRNIRCFLFDQLEEVIIMVVNSSLMCQY